MFSSSRFASLITYREFVAAEIGEGESGIDPAPCIFPDVYLSSSCLQKALRRGEGAFALAAGRHLLRFDEDRLWRRLCVCVFEDFGLVNLEMTARVVAVCQSKSFRLVQGQGQVLSYVIGLLCALPKDRRLDDLYALGVGSFADRSRQKLLESGEQGAVLAPLVHEAARLIALCERPIPRRSYRTLSISGCDHALAQMARQEGADQALLEICRVGMRVSKCLLPLLLPLALSATKASAETGIVMHHRLPVMPQVNGIPAYAFDGFTRAGRAILVRLAAHEPRLANLLNGLPSAARLDVLHHLLFFAEGARVDRLLSDPLSRGLNIYAVALGARLPQPEADQAVELMERCLPVIHALRGVLPLPNPPEDLS